mmetsp:Transcript_100797/g.217553  ORF Transcript_100797/g.217553 Transcript_100797/m.217553 type:complete len:400 (-) Transcript_100797:77-1276(-)
MGRCSAIFVALFSAWCICPAGALLRRRRGVFRLDTDAGASGAASSSAAVLVEWSGAVTPKGVPRCENKNCSADELTAVAELESTWEQEEITAGLATRKQGRSTHDVMHQVMQPLDDARTSLLMATFAGAATLVGALVLPCLPEEGPPPPVMAFSMSLAAGVMVAVAMEMLAPGISCLFLGEGQDCVEGVGMRPLLIAAAGGVACLLLCRLADMLHPQDALEALAEGAESMDKEQQLRSRRLAFLLFVSLTAHNIPEGFAVAVSAHSSATLGATVCIAVALHNIPEGVTLAVATFAATKSRVQATIVAAVAGFAEPLGALLAVVLLQAYITAQFVSDMLAGVAGVMGVIAICELLPEAAATKCWGHVTGGFATGLAVMIITHHVLESVGGEDGHGHGHHH